MRNSISRRALLRGLGGAASILATPGIVQAAPAFLRGQRGDPSPSDLFSLGVGSGDPFAHSVVLWTRLAPDPLNGGGMVQRPVPVKYRIALDPGMAHVVRSGVTVALPEAGHAVQATVFGLPSNTWFWYQFEAMGARSRIGRTRTFPAWHEDVERLRFALVSCQNFTAGYYTAYRDMLDQHIDFVLHSGDYIYESGVDATPLLPERNHTGGEIFSLNDYRTRYALYRLDADLQDAHANVPFLCTWDDHEVDNNYAGRIAEEGAPYSGELFVQRRRNAYQVYRESMALRPKNELLMNDGEMRIYREFLFGCLASIYMLDTRQYRSDQPAGDGFGSIDPDAAALEPVFGEQLYDPAIESPSATLLGRNQERWLGARLSQSQAHWNILGQQVMVTPWNLRAAGRTQVALDPNLPPAQKAAILALFDNVASIVNVDAWDGYAAAQRRLLDLIAATGASNPVVLTGDIHAAWGANLLTDFANPSGADMIAAEFVCSSITSTFLTADPRPADFVVRASLVDNPHISFFNGLYRGYCLCDVDRNRWRTEYRAVFADPRSTDPLAFVPRPDSLMVTDKVLQLDAGFNVPGSGKRLQTGTA